MQNQNVPNYYVPIFCGQNVPKPKHTQFVTNTNHTLLHIFCTIDKNTRDTRKEERKYFI